MFLFRLQMEQQLWQGFYWIVQVTIRTFVTEKLAKELKLKSQCRELLSVSTFGAKNPHDVDTYVVNFNVMTKDNSPFTTSC